nr:hypothetical protein [Tanacetum cinerariifolium]
MLNKENYVLWLSRLLRYAKSKTNGKLIYNSIRNGLYVKRMIPEPGDPNCKVHVNETFHVQINDELTKKELIEADDQAIQTILGLPENIYAAIDSCETAQKIWLRVQQMMKARAEGNVTGNNGNQIRCYNCIGLGHFARNCTQALTSGTQTGKALVYDSDGSAEVHNYDNCYDNEIFNMFTQEEQYTELLEPIFEPHQVPQNDNNVIFEGFSVEQSGGTT